jgi:hypothetical protein
MEDYVGLLLAWLPGFIVLIPAFVFLRRLAGTIKKTRTENAAFRERTAEFWDKTLTLQAESNQLIRELVAQLRSRR